MQRRKSLEQLISYRVWDHGWGSFGIQTVRLQPENGGEFINEPFIEGCYKNGVCMTQIPPYQP
eukprot:810089-Prorocentrum_lima.AAC.1